MKCIAAFSFVLAGSMLAQTPVAAPPNPFKTTDGTMRVSSEDPAKLEAYMPALYKSSHAANLALLKNGDLGLIWMSGDVPTHYMLLLSFKAKGSSTWSKPVALPAPPTTSLENPVLFQEPKGDVWVFGTDEGQIYGWRSTDYARTFAAPVKMFPEKAVTREPVVMLDHGTWAFSVYYAPTPNPVVGAENHYSALELTSDEGKTWKECVVPDSKGLVQPMVVHLHADDNIAFMRSRFADWLYLSHSKDGCTWTTPVATTMPNNNASIQAVRLHDGKIVIAFDNTHSKTTREKPEMPARYPLSLGLSDDDGKTWKWIRDLEVDTSKDPKTQPGVRQEYSYPSVIETPDHKITVAYTFRRQTIKVITVDETWIEKGSTAGFLQPTAK